MRRVISLICSKQNKTVCLLTEQRLALTPVTARLSDLRCIHGKQMFLCRFVFACVGTNYQHEVLFAASECDQVPVWLRYQRFLNTQMHVLNQTLDTYAALFVMRKPLMLMRKYNF